MQNKLWVQQMICRWCRFGIRLSLFATLLGFGWLVTASTLQARMAEESTGSFTCSAVSGISQSECNALVALYNNTNGAQWVTHTNWLNTNQPCSWAKVVCTNGHVIQLNLSNNNLNGTLPADIGNLSWLTELWMGNNQLTGSIPPQIGTLTSLTGMSLSQNDLSGSIPTEFSNLKNLNRLWLGNNRLSGSIPSWIGTFSNLDRLGLATNRFSGSIPSELGNLTKLTTLGLLNNQLSGQIPTSLTNLTATTSLDLNYNKLESDNPTLIAFLNTRDSGWQDTQTLPPTNIAASTSNNIIQLSWTPIAYTAHGGYYEIYYATAESGPYTLLKTTSDKTTSSLSLPELDSNRIYYFTLRTYTPSHDIQQNELLSTASAPVASTPENFSCSVVTQIPTLECNALVALYQGTQGESWTNHSGWLARNTPCDWDGVTCANGHVSQLILANNNLVGTLPSQIGDFAELTTLRVEDNFLAGSIPSTLGNLTKLTNATLSRNQFTGPLPSTIGNLVELTAFWLHDNKLSGSLPTTMGTMRSLRRFGAMDNQFGGTLPTQIGDLSNLTELYLSQNLIEGPIPESIGKLSNLQLLLLPNNRFSNELPQAMSNLSQLSRFNIDYNAVTVSTNALRDFLNARNLSWASTQTEPPSNLRAGLISQTTIELIWQTIAYQSDNGYYEIEMATTPNGPFQRFTETADKSTSSQPVGGLQPDQFYYFRARAYTPSHDKQQSPLWSDYTETLVVRTLPAPTPTDTFTPTPTISPTPTGTRTPDPPTATPMPCTTQIADRVGCNMYLPVIVLEHATDTPTPTATPTATATPTLAPTTPPSWQRFPQVLPELDVIAIHNGSLFVGNRDTAGENSNSGLYALNSCVLDAQPQRLIADVNVQDIAFSSSGSAGLVATNGNSLYYSTNIESQWQPNQSAIDRYTFAVVFINSNLAYGGGDDGVYQSSNGGVTWNKVQPLAGNGPTQINNFQYHSGSNALWIATHGNGVWKLQAGTNIFEQRRIGLVDERDLKVWDIELSNVGDIYIATSNGVYTSGGGSNWSSYGLTGSQVLSLAIVDSYLYAGLKLGGLQRIPLDNSAGWQQVDGLPTTLTVRSLLYDQSGLCDPPIAQRQAILAATDDDDANAGLWIYR